MKLSGIYRILNTVNGKSYVGKSTSIQARWATHRRTLRLGQHHSEHLQRAWDKYGEASFHFEILHLESDVAKLPELEYRFVSEMGADNPLTGYNLNLVTPTSYTPSATTRAKLSPTQKLLQTPEQRAHLSNVQKGVPKTEDAKRKMSEVWHQTHQWSDELKEKWSQIRQGKTHTEETRAKISAGLKGHTVSTETREKSSQVQKANMTPERRAEMSARKKAWWAAKKAQDES